MLIELGSSEALEAYSARVIVGSSTPGEEWMLGRVHAALYITCSWTTFMKTSVRLPHPNLSSQMHCA